MDLQAIMIFLALCIPFFLMTIWAVVNAAQKDFPSFREKVIWLMVTAIPFIGFIIYLIFGFRRGKKSVDGLFG